MIIIIVVVIVVSYRPSANVCRKCARKIRNVDLLKAETKVETYQEKIAKFTIQYMTTISIRSP